MTNPATAVIGGVDTHKHTHYAAAIDDHGRLLGHREFPARANGYAALLQRLRSQGQVVTIGIESTGNFGAALTRYLADAGEQVLEVNKPNHRAATSRASQTASMPSRSPGRCWPGPGSQHRRRSRVQSRSPAPCDHRHVAPTLGVSPSTRAGCGPPKAILGGPWAQIRASQVSPGSALRQLRASMPHRSERRAVCSPSTTSDAAQDNPIETCCAIGCRGARIR